MKKAFAFLFLCCLGHKPVTGLTYTDHAPISYSGASNLTISGYKIEGGGSACITLYNCHDIRITKNLVNSSDTYGIVIQNCYNISIDSNFVSNCHVVGIQAANCTGNIRIISNQVSEVYSPNLLKAGSGNSIEFYQCSGANNAIDSNVISHTLTAAIDGTGNGAGDNLDVLQCNGTSGSRIKIYYNQIRGGGTYTLGNGRDGIGVGDVGGSYQDCEYNTLVNTGWGGIQLAGGTNITVAHNQIYSDNLAWSCVGLHSFSTSSSITTANDSMMYNSINWYNGYSGIARGDTLYSNANGNPLPYGFRTLNTVNAGITSGILPTTILTYITPTQLFPQIVRSVGSH
jgi:parallel beta helix pectate lyase-like protein